MSIVLTSPCRTSRLECAITAAAGAFVAGHSRGRSGTWLRHGCPVTPAHALQGVGMHVDEE
eukprot:scaffold304266_cov21-Tisochrysis_lutea.AAC.1